MSGWEYSGSGQDVYGVLEKDTFGEFLAWFCFGLLIIFIAAAIIIPIYMKFFYKGKNRTVEIVKRRKTVRDLFFPRLNAANKSSYVEYTNYTLDVKYAGSRIHTLSCSEEIYESVKEGKTYDVHIRLHDVTKIQPR